MIFDPSSICRVIIKLTIEQHFYIFIYRVDSSNTSLLASALRWAPTCIASTWPSVSLWIGRTGSGRAVKTLITSGGTTNDTFCFLNCLIFLSVADMSMEINLLSHAGNFSITSKGQPLTHFIFLSLFK